MQDSWIQLLLLAHVSTVDRPLRTHNCAPLGLLTCSSTCSLDWSAASNPQKSTQDSKQHEQRCSEQLRRANQCKLFSCRSDVWYRLAHGVNQQKDWSIPALTNQRPFTICDFWQRDHCGVGGPNDRGCEEVLPSVPSTASTNSIWISSVPPCPDRLPEEDPPACCIMRTCSTNPAGVMAEWSSPPSSDQETALSASKVGHLPQHPDRGEHQALWSKHLPEPRSLLCVDTPLARPGSDQ